MKKRILWFSVFAVLVIMIFFIAVMINITASYRASAQDILRNYRTSGKTVTELVKTAVENNAAIVYSVQDHIYDGLLESIEENPGKFRMPFKSPIAVYDTVTEGFYFSNKARQDSFVLTLMKGFDIYRASESMKWFLTLRKESGPGTYIQKLQGLSFIKYIVLQDEQGIITATGNIDSVKSIIADTMLMFAFIEGQDIFRKTADREYVFEYVSPDKERGYLIRAGFDASQYEDAVNRSRTLYIIISVIIIIMAALIMMMVFFYYRSAMYADRLIKRESERAAYFNMLTEGIVVTEGNEVTAYNDSSLRILGIESKDMNYEFLSRNGLLKQETISGLHTELGDIKLLHSVSSVDGRKIIAFSDITELEELRRENEIKKKQALLGELSSRVAHELKNPLNGISMIVQRILKDGISDEHNEMLKEAIDEIERMNSRIVQFTGFAKPIEYNNEEIALADILKTAEENIRILLREKNIELHENADEINVYGDREYLITAFTNILLNAAEAVEHGGKILLNAACRDGNAYIEIKDNGPGFDREQLERAFDLYFTTKRNGSGIGLSTAMKIINEHSGEISLRNENGAVVCVKLKCIKE